MVILYHTSILVVKNKKVGAEIMKISTCNLRKGSNILITYYRYGYEKEESISVKNVQTVDQMFDFICRPDLNILSVYFCFCDENIKEERAVLCRNTYILEDFYKAYDYVVKNIRIADNSSEKK